MSQNDDSDIQPDQALILDYLDGEMSREGMKLFAERLESEPELRQLVDAMEQVWLKPPKEKREPAAAAPTAVAGTVAQTAPAVSTFPARLPRLARTAVLSGVGLALAGGVFLALRGGASKGGEALVGMRDDARQWQRNAGAMLGGHAPVWFIEDPKVVVTGPTDTITVTIPGGWATIFPGSRFTYDSVSKPIMYAALDGEAVIEIDRFWTFSFDAGPVSVMAGRYALRSPVGAKRLEMSIERGTAAVSVSGDTSRHFGPGDYVTFTREPLAAWSTKDPKGFPAFGASTIAGR